MATNDSDPAAERHRELHDGRHPDAVEEWVFAAWTPDGDLGLLSGHRIVGPTAWYWAALARSGRPLLHITDFDVPVRADPFIVKGEAMWAEHFRDDPMRQWSVGNETYAAALDDPDDALGRAYGIPTPIAFDLEWYATGEPDLLAVDDGAGYRQSGTVHGVAEVLDEPRIELTEVPARRWHRWVVPSPDASVPIAARRAAASLSLGPIPVDAASAHTGLRAPFAFPNGSTIDLVLSPQGWHRRR
ncbi:MAG: hypothetical protein AB8G26_18730 [Ilumatobacter sp.]